MLGGRFSAVPILFFTLRVKYASSAAVSKTDTSAFFWRVGFVEHRSQVKIAYNAASNAVVPAGSATVSKMVPARWNRKDCCKDAM